MEEDSKGFDGLEFARQLKFSEAQYEEACKMINSPDDTNQLVSALIDVDRRGGDTCCATQTSNGSTINANHQQLAKSSSHYVSLTLPTAVNTLPEESSSSSCYSSITSFPSSSDQSLDSLQQNQHVALKKIYIDGPNVARSHSKDASFSWRGIKIAVDWFLDRQHRVKVFVPEDRCHHVLEERCHQPEEHWIVDHLQRLDVLVRTPSGCNDDLFVIEAARHNNGVIVSNDLYRDEIRLNELQRFIHLNRLPYVFVDDLFIPAKDPRGRSGPLLVDFLKDVPEVPNVHGKLYRAKSHQRYQRNGSVKQSQNFSAFQHQRSSLQSTRSLPVEQSRNSNNDIGNQLIIPGSNQYQRQRNSYNDQPQHYHHLASQNHRQQVRRAKSVAHTNSTNPKDTSDVQPSTGPRKALCNSKSHDA